MRIRDTPSAPCADPEGISVRGDHGGTGYCITGISFKEQFYKGTSGKASGDHNHCTEYQWPGNQYGIGRPGAGSLWKGIYHGSVCGCTFRISSKSFYQVNPVQTEKLYNLAIELAGLTGKETVLDAYCGIGTIGIIASRKAGQVIGVELNQDAVRDAVNNAKLNQISNIRFYCKMPASLW